MRSTSLSTPAPITKYVVVFILAQALLLAAANVLFYKFGVDLGKANIGVLLASIAITALMFVVDHGRPFLKREKRRLAFLCVLMSIIVSYATMYLVAMFVPETGRAMLQASRLLAGLEAGSLVLAIILVLGIYYFIINFSLGLFAKMAAKYC